MIGGIRKFARSKWAIVLLFIPLIVSFGIFGFNDPFSGVMGGGFVQVGDHQVRQLDVSRAVDGELNRIREESGEILTPRDAARRGLTQQILGQRILRASLLAYADKIGVKASATAVSNMLKGAPLFKDALGRINMEAVARYAEQQGMTLEEFQNDLRHSLTAEYVRDAAFTGVVTPEILTRPLLNYFGETRTLSIARLTKASILEPKAPTGEELRAWYAQHAGDFRQPERRRISILSYSDADFMDKVPVSDADIKAQYDRRIREFSTPETRFVAQFTGERAALQGFVDIAKQGVALDEALRRSPGVTRAELTLKPGDLTDKQYNDFVFAIPPNAIQGPLQVGETWYAVQVTSIEQGVATPLEQVREQIREEIAKTEARRMYDGTYKSFYDMAGGISLEEISQQIGAPVIELAPIDQNGQTASGRRSSLAEKHAQAVRALFTLSVGQTTDVIEGDNERAILRVDEIVAPHTLAFEDVQADVKVRFLAEEGERAANKLANDMAAAVKAGRTFEQAAAASRMATLGAVDVMRAGGAAIDQQVQAGAFNLQVGDTAVVRGQGNEPWVVRVDKVTPVTPEAEAGLRAQIDSQIVRSLGNDLQETFIRGIQKEVKVDTNEQAIQAYLENLTKDEAQ